jgi:hypothetical protein
MVAKRILFQKRASPKRLNSAEFWIVLFFGTFIFGGFAAELVRDFSPAKLSVVFMAVAWAPLLLLHEVGHALVAAWLGWKVCRIVIGLGPTILRFSVNGVPVDVRLFPVSGFVVPAPRSLEAARVKSALVYFAGPGAELLVVLLLVAVVGYGRLLEHHDAVGLIAAQSVAIAALMGVLFNLLPMKNNDGSQTDGLGLILSFVWPRQHFERMIATPYRIKAEQRIERGDLDGAVRVFEDAVREQPENLPLSVGLAEVLVEAGRSRESRELLAPLVERSHDDDPWRVSLLCAIAEAERELGDDACVEQADEHSKIALELAPGSAWTMLVRASVLLTQAHFHPALRLLQQARDAANDRLLVDECDCWLILADHRRGNREQARERLAQLQKRGTMGRLILAVETEVLGRPAASEASPAESA